MSVEGERTRRTIRESADQRQQRAVNWPAASAPLPPPSVAEQAGTPATEALEAEMAETTVAELDEQLSEQPQHDFDLDDYVISPKPDK